MRDKIEICKALLDRATYDLKRLIKYGTNAIPDNSHSTLKSGSLFKNLVPANLTR